MYRHILDHLVDRFGAEAAVALGPKLCSIALQFNEPGGVMSDMLRDLDDAKGNIDILVKMSPARRMKVAVSAAAAGPAVGARSPERKFQPSQAPAQACRRPMLCRTAANK